MKPWTSSPAACAAAITPEGLAFIDDYADGIGPWKPYLLQTRIYDPDNDGVADDRNGDGIVDIFDAIILANNFGKKA